jgi:hypothetical protein
MAESAQIIGQNPHFHKPENHNECGSIIRNNWFLHRHPPALFPLQLLIAMLLWQ